ATAAASLPRRPDPPACARRLSHVPASTGEAADQARRCQKVSYRSTLPRELLRRDGHFSPVAPVSLPALCASAPADKAAVPGRVLAGVTPSAVSKRICWKGRGRSPLQTRAAVAVSGRSCRLTRIMSWVGAGRVGRTGPDQVPAMVRGPVSTAAGRPPV